MDQILKKNFLDKPIKNLPYFLSRDENPDKIMINDG
jgi:hypothetical protein